MSLKSVFNGILLGSNAAGTIHIKRFSTSKFSVKRFSTDGEVLAEEVVIDDTVPATEDIAESLPTEEVAVFSNEEEKTDEIVVGVDGGSLDEVIQEKKDEDFVEDSTKEEDDDEGKDD